jgi:hypothetical protein
VIIPAGKDKQDIALQSIDGPTGTEGELFVIDRGVLQNLVGSASQEAQNVHGE